MRQLGIKENIDKQIRERTIQFITRRFYQVGISFNAAKLKSFDHMVKAIAQYDPDLRLPSYHELKAPLLEKKLQETMKDVEEYQKIQQEKGYTLMSNGWSDHRE